MPPRAALRGAQLTLSYDRKQIILKRNEVSEELGGQYVELYDFPNRPLEVRWKGHSLPYRVFAKDQRVSQTAIAENKRLGVMCFARSRCSRRPIRLPRCRPTAVRAAIRSEAEESTGQTTKKARHRQKRWRCRSDGKHGRPTIKLSVSHPSHSPWTPPNNGGSHIPTARRRLYTVTSTWQK